MALPSFLVVASGQKISFLFVYQFVQCQAPNIKLTWILLSDTTVLSHLSDHLDAHFDCHFSHTFPFLYIRFLRFNRCSLLHEPLELVCKEQLSIGTLRHRVEYFGPICLQEL